MYRPCDPCAVRRCSQFLIGTSRYNFQDLAVSHNGDCVQLRSDIGRPSLTETSRGRAVTGSAAISVFSPVSGSSNPPACRLAAIVRQPRMIVIVGRARKRAKVVATDLRYGAPLCPETTVVGGDYDDLAEANRRHRSLRQYHDHRRPMTPASLALASWRLRPRNW
jgi:hypothetical protein